MFIVSAFIFYPCSFVLLWLIIVPLYVLLSSSIILSVDFMQCSSCLIKFLIIVNMVLQVGCLKLTEIYHND